MSKNNIKVIFRLGAQFFRGCYSRDAWTAEATFTKVFYAVSRVFVRPGFRLLCARFAVHYLTVYSVLRSSIKQTLTATATSTVAV